MGHDPQDLEEKLPVICDIELKVRRGDWRLNHGACITVSMWRDRLRKNHAIKFGIGSTSVIATNDLHRDAVLECFVYNGIRPVRQLIEKGAKTTSGVFRYPGLMRVLYMYWKRVPLG